MMIFSNGYFAYIWSCAIYISPKLKKFQTMEKLLKVLLLVFISINSCDQNKKEIHINKTENSNNQRIEKFAKKIIQLIENKDVEKLAKLTSNNIYCYLCFDKTPKKKPFIKRETFYRNHFNQIFDTNLVNRLKRNKRDLIKGSSSDYGDWGISYIIHRKDEWADGHEGTQFIFWMIEDNSEFKISGIESLP